IDATENGLQLMDAYIQIHEPNYKALSLRAGLFNRPFGHSLAFSSGYRDVPERARVFQTVLSRERDIGAMLAFTPENAFKFITAEVAVVNGSGFSARDYDSKKDIIGNLSFKFDSLANKKLNLGFGGSVYTGSVRNDTESYYTDNGNGFTKNTSPNFEGYHAKRQYFGANLQLDYDNAFGRTIFKAEYVGGTQPGVAASADISGPDASQSFAEQPATDLYLRSFSGYYLWLTQRIFKSKFSALLSYDVYDPNTNIEEDEIGNNNNTTAGDIKFSTLGYGINYVPHPRIKFTLFNEHVFNDDTSLPDYPADLKDNVFTARLQYRW
ncbi:porin, partial [Pedobacter sp.]|uniref:porin n=1 Tax=Pedobacter sp. TaxID=1411316 RepID=UPI003D7FF3F4